MFLFCFFAFVDKKEKLYFEKKILRKKNKKKKEYDDGDSNPQLREGKTSSDHEASVLSTELTALLSN